jgi:hypothetical protein
MQQVIIKDLPKVSSNKIYAGAHWSKRNKLKEGYLYLTKNAFQKLKPVEGLVDIEFDFYFTRNALDSSNCSYMAKMLEDCLIEWKALKDDTIKYVRSIKLTSSKSKPKEADYCVITLNEV